MAAKEQNYVDEFPHRSFVRQAGFYVFAGAVSAGIAAFVLRDMDANQDDGRPDLGPPSPHPPAEPYRSECVEHTQCRQENPGLAATEQCCPDINGKFASCCAAIPSTVSVEPFYGMCYAAVPTNWMDNTRQPNNPTLRVQDGPVSDDYWSLWSRPFWGAPPLRDDLGRMAELGVKVVRLYGNDPRQDHTEFLDRAEELGLSVVVGMSNYIYTQAERDGLVSCAKNTRVGGGHQPEDFDCRQPAFEQFRQMLSRGLTRPTGYNRTNAYHPAVKAILVVNEPELQACQQESRNIGGQIVEQCFTDGETRTRALYTKAVISALDGMRSAEKEMDIVEDHDGNMPPFTVTWTFGACDGCLTNLRGNELPNCNCGDGSILCGGSTRSCRVGGFPGMAMMYDFAVGMLRPELLNYPHPANDLRELLQNRFMLGFNSQNRMAEICAMLLSPLRLSVLNNIPLWQGEFKAHDVSTDVDGSSRDTVEMFREDLRSMRDYVDAAHNPQCTAPNGRQLQGKQVQGFGIFEFQVPYYKNTFPEAQKCWGFTPTGTRMPAHTGDWQFGIYSFGNTVNGTVSRAFWEETGNQDFEVWCLRDRVNVAGSSWAKCVADVLGGRHRDYDDCPPEIQEGVLHGGEWCD